MEPVDHPEAPLPPLREWARAYREALTRWDAHLADGGEDPSVRPLQDRQRIIAENWTRGQIAAEQTADALRRLPPYSGAEDFQLAQEEQFRELAVTHGQAAAAAADANGDEDFERIALAVNREYEKAGARLRNTPAPIHVLDALRAEGLYREPNQWNRFTNWLGSWQGILVVGVVVAALFFGYEPFGMDLNPFDDTQTVTVPRGGDIPLARAGDLEVLLIEGFRAQDGRQTADGQDAVIRLRLTNVRRQRSEWFGPGSFHAITTGGEQLEPRWPSSFETFGVNYLEPGASTYGYVVFKSTAGIREIVFNPGLDGRYRVRWRFE